MICKFPISRLILDVDGEIKITKKARKKTRIRRPFKGSLEPIFNEFIKPLIKLKPKQMHFNDWMDELFCVHDRFITRCIAKTDFKIPGLYCAAPNRLIPGWANTLVKKESEVWVRVDETMPDRIDVETFNGDRGESQIFALTRYDFKRILPHLVESPFRKRKRNGHSWEKS